MPLDPTYTKLLQDLMTTEPAGFPSNTVELPTAPVAEVLTPAPQPAAAPILEIPSAPLPPAVVPAAPVAQPDMGLDAVQSGIQALGLSQQRQDDLLDKQNKALTEKAIIEEDFNKEKALEQSLYTERLSSELDIIGQKQQELEKLEPKDFWADKTTGQKIGMSLAVLLGSIGQGLSGAKENAAIVALNQAMDRDLALQESKYKRSQAALATRRQGVGELKDLQAARLQDISARQAAAVTQVMSQLDKVALGLKSEESKQKVEMLKADLGVKLAGVQEQIRKNVADSLVGQPQEGGTPRGMTDVGKPQTDAQMSAESFLARMKAVEPALANTEVLMKAPPGWSQLTIPRQLQLEAAAGKGGFGLPGALVDLGTSITKSTAMDRATPEQKKVLVAAREFIAAKLRKESGAAISDSEFAREYGTNFPMPGDTAATLKQKEQIRKTAMEALQLQTGRNVRGIK